MVRRRSRVPLWDNRGGAESEPGQTVATPDNDTGTLSVVTHTPDVRLQSHCALAKCCLSNQMAVSIYL